MDLIVKELDGKNVAEYVLRQGEVLDKTSLGMLVNNKIDGIAKAEIKAVGSDNLIVFDVDGKVKLSEFLGIPVKKDDFLNIMLSIAVSIKKSSEYLLKEVGFILESEKMFLDVSSKEVTLVYLPIQAQASDGDTCNFFKKLLFGTQFAPNEDMAFMTKLLMMLNQPDSYEIEKFIGEIEGLLGKTPTKFKKKYDDELVDIAAKAEKDLAEVKEKCAKAEEIRQAEKKKAEEARLAKIKAEDEARTEAIKAEDEARAAALAEIESKKEEEAAAETAEKEAVEQVEAETETSEPETSQAGAEVTEKPEEVETAEEKPEELEKLVEETVETVEKREEAAEKEAEAVIETGAEKEAAENTAESDKTEVTSTEAIAEAEKIVEENTETIAEKKVEETADTAEEMKIEDVKNELREASKEIENEVKETESETEKVIEEAEKETEKPIEETIEETERVIEDTPEEPEAEADVEDTTEGETPREESPEEAEPSESVEQEEVVVNRVPGKGSIPYLERNFTGEEIEITTDRFAIGSDPDNANYCIEGNELIAPIHAYIEKSGDDYIIIDNDSENHTYLNDVEVQPYMDMFLMNGMVIKLADEELTFRIR